MALIHTADPASWEWYLSSLPLAESTRALYGAIGRRWIEEGESPTAAIQRALDASSDGRLPPGTASTYRAVIGHWEAWTGRRLNPAPQIPTRSGSGASQSRYLEPSQLDRFRCAVHAERVALTPPVADLLLFMPESGLRVAEACRLRWDQIEMPGGDEPLAWITLTGKGGRERRIPITPAGTRQLRNLRRSKRNPAWVFPSRSPYGIRNQRHVTKGHVRRQWNAVRERHDLNAVSPHWLRHTYATGLREAGVEIADIQALLGHANVSTTLRYAKPTRAGLRRAVSTLGTNREGK